MVKKILFSFGTLLATSVAMQAQITITAGDIAGIGIQVKQANDTLPTVTPGPAGANVTWNFSALNTHGIDTLTFTNPNWTQYGSQFPTSNLAVAFGNNGIAYTYLTGSTFNIQGQVGMFGTTTVVLDMNPDEVFITFPSTFNTSFNNTSGYDEAFPFTQQPGVDSVRVRHDQTKTSLVNAWGTVTTPLLNNQQCIRQRSYLIITDTVWAHVTFPQPSWQMIQSTMDTVVRFTWWANGIGFPLVEMDSLTDGTITNVNWLQATPTNSGIYEQSTISAIHVYPNPASDQISFDLRTTGGEFIVVYDVAGRELARFGIKNEIEMLHTSAFAEGAYLFTVTSEGRVVGRGKFNIVN